MASLRDLIDKGQVDAGGGGYDVGTQPAWISDPYCSMVFLDRCSTNRYCNSYERWCFSCWFIHNDVGNTIIFEAWGGGGGGAGSCNCAWGPPGGAGAYAKFVLDNTSGQYCCCRYCMCVSGASCCSPNRSCGYRGCRSYINGPELSGFCAEGGLPGCSICCFQNVFPNSGCGIYMHPNHATDCACYYGPTGTSGVAGRHGGIEATCCDASNWCIYKTIFPLPGGLGRTDVGYRVVRNHGNTGNYQDRCYPGTWAIDNAIGGGKSDSQAVGQGGSTARVCGGGCCCGSPGGPGLIKISWNTN